MPSKRDMVSEKRVLDRRPPLGTTYWAITAASFAVFLLLMFVSLRLCLLFFAAWGIGDRIYFMCHGVSRCLGSWIHREDHPIQLWLSDVVWFLAMALVIYAAFGP